MADLDKRIRMAAESILENEALRGGAGDEQTATMLLNWGIARAKSIMMDTAGIEDDEEADEAVYPRMKALRKLLVAVKELAVSQGQELAAWQNNIMTVFKHAETVYGPGWHVPDQIGDEIWLILQTGSSLERVQGIQMLIEPPESLPVLDPAPLEPVLLDNGPTQPDETVIEDEYKPDDRLSFSITEDVSRPESAQSLEISKDNSLEKDKGVDNVTFNKQTPI